MNTGEILAGGAGLVRTQPKAIAIWGILYLVVAAAMTALVWPLMQGFVQAQQQAMIAQAAGAPPQLPDFGGFFLAILGFNFVLLAVLAAIFAAAVRAVARGGSDSFGFLRFGGDELRLIGLVLLLIGIGFGLSMVAGLALGVIGGVIAAVAGGGGQPGAGMLALFFIVYVAILAAMIWAQVRISLAGAYTVLRGRIVIGEAWRATRGRFWTLFRVYLLIFIAYLIVTIVLIAILYPGLLGSYVTAMQGDPAALQAMAMQQQATMANLFGPRLIIGALAGTAAMMTLIAFAFGAVATAAIGFDRADHNAAAEAL